MTTLQMVAAKRCAQEQVPTEGLPGTQPSRWRNERKRRSQRSGRPQGWRTCTDPGEGEWEALAAGLQANPGLPGVEIFPQVGPRSPDRSPPPPVRALQRPAGKRRAPLLVTCDDPWDTGEANGLLPTPELRAEIMRTSPSNPLSLRARRVCVLR